MDSVTDSLKRSLVLSLILGLVRSVMDTCNGKEQTCTVIYILTAMPHR
nr:hypothetical protein [uncultured Janthinobacterium sp.]